MMASARASRLPTTDYLGLGRLQPSRHLLLLLCLLALAGQSDSARAQNNIPVGYARAAADLRITPVAAYLSTLALSGFKLDNGCWQPWPWTVSVNGVSHYYPSRAEAHTALLTALRQGYTDIKVGLMQMAVLATDATRLNDLLEPATNLRLGLSQLPLAAETALPALRQRYHRLGLAGFCQRSFSLRKDRSRATFKRQGKVNPQLTALVHELARPYQVDPALVMAVMQQESGFKPAALSPKKAQGLMQLMPQTALRFGVRHPFEAKDNIRGGIAYLHWLLRHFNGNVALVLAGYNAGEQAVERYQGIPPYAETQHYVRAIMANYPNSRHPIPPPVSS
jgi:hypothetical protein